MAALNKQAIQEYKRGWLVLVAAFFGIGCGISSLSFYTSGIFMVPLEQEFGWSRSVISATGIFGVAMLSILSPIIGVLIDRYGIRLVAFFSLACYSLGMFLNSFLFDSMIFLYGLAIVTAFFAAGSSPVTFTRAITGWFDAARGQALGLALLGAGVASVLAPLLLTQSIENYGWRMTYRLLAAVILFAAVFVAIFLREDPEDSTEKATSKAMKRKRNEGISARKAYKIKVFYHLAFIFVLISFAVSGLIVHFIPLMTDMGKSVVEAGKLASIIGFSIMAGRLLVGFLIDKFFAPFVAAIFLGGATIGYIVFIFGGANYAVFAAIAIGLSMGAEVDLIGYMVSRYFGLKAYGVIYGSLYSVFLIGAGLSPFAAGLVFDSTNSYAGFLIFSTGCMFIAAILCLTLPRFPTLRNRDETQIVAELTSKTSK